MNPPCAHCKSPITVKNGKSEGHQQYRCRDCKRTFKGKYTPKVLAQTMPCPCCDHDRLQRNGKHRGIQYYWCPRCRKKFADSTLPRSGPPCYYCARPLDKQGIKHGKLWYYCPDCNERWDNVSLPDVCLGQKFYWSHD